MPRSVPEWIGKNDNARAPARVHDRLVAAHKDCYLCGRGFVDGAKVELDHVIALINGGENREGNLRPVHSKCHKTKSAADVAEKAKVAAKRQKHLGIQTTPVQRLAGAPFRQSSKAARRQAHAELVQSLAPKRLFETARPSPGDSQP